GSRASHPWRSRGPPRLAPGACRATFSFARGVATVEGLTDADGHSDGAAALRELLGRPRSARVKPARGPRASGHLAPATLTSPGRGPARGGEGVTGNDEPRGHHRPWGRPNAELPDDRQEHVRLFRIHACAESDHVDGRARRVLRCLLDGRAETE